MEKATRKCLAEVAGKAAQLPFQGYMEGEESNLEPVIRFFSSDEASGPSGFFAFGVNTLSEVTLDLNDLTKQRANLIRIIRQPGNAENRPLCPRGKRLELNVMKKVLCTVIMIFIVCSLSALADHSVLTAPGDIDETQALDIAVKALCDQLQTDEYQIRGHWYFYGDYYSKWIHLEDYKGAVWYIDLVDPVIQSESDMYDGYCIHRRFAYLLNASNGEILEMEESTALDDINDPYDLIYMYVPTKEQMQPAEALCRAQELLMNALGCDRETLNSWRDYILEGSSTEDGRFWYHVFMGYGGWLGNETGPFSWHVYFDANTGDVVWQTDPERIAGRLAIQSSGQEWSDWYREQKDKYEREWGNINSWDYHQYAEFEEHCYGLPYWPEEHYGLPLENEYSYEEALSMAENWLKAQENESHWILKSSAFYADLNNWYHSLLRQGIKSKERVWSFVFVNDDDPATEEEVYVDPSTGRIVDGPHG